MEEKHQAIHKFLSTGEIPSGFNSSQKFSFRRTCASYTLKDGELFFGKRRVVKSEEEARALFNEVHALGSHSGITKTCSAISMEWYWKGMSIDIANWVQECEKCQKVDKPPTPPEPLQCVKVSTVWEFVAIDVVGPFLTTQDGYRYILTATDYFSKWVEAFPMKKKSSLEVARHVCSMIYRHGCPKRILSDQGSEFINQINTRICTLLGVEKCVIAAYHAQTKEIDEITDQNVKQALMKLVDEKQNEWDVYLDATLFALRSTIQTTTKYSPFLLMYGREAYFPSEDSFSCITGENWVEHVLTLPDEDTSDMMLS